MFAEQALIELMYKNDSLREQIAFEQRSLQKCREDLADPRLGGSGNVLDFEVEHPSTLTEVNSEFHIGLNGKEQLKVVKRRGFEKTLIAEQKQVELLRSSLKFATKNTNRM